MSQQIHLTYENGVFRPRAEELETLQLREGQEIEATLAADLKAEAPKSGNVHLLRELAGSIPPEDIAEMEAAIEEGCGKINPRGW